MTGAELLEDITGQDRALIADRLEGVANQAGRYGLNEIATEIGALVAKIRRENEAIPVEDKND